MTHACDVQLLGHGYRCITGMGSPEGCLKEARGIIAKFKKRGEHFTMMGSGDWQSEHVLVSVYPWRNDYHNPKIYWNFDEVMMLVKKLRQKEASNDQA